MQIAASAVGDRVRVKPVSVCVAVTVTPGSTAPLSSVTRPAELGRRLRPRGGAGQKENRDADQEVPQQTLHELVLLVVWLQ